ncbi:MAG: serine/threonine protein kinase [Acidobacteriota bacterium]|nr:serine/threonine protein kinase [Acidobacteriota bacterium]
MSDPRHVRAREVFLGACERAQEERSRYLDEECGEDEALRRDVSALLVRHDEALKVPATAPDDGPRRFRSGELFAGRYRIVSLLGEGGMGQVYRADDETLGVPVAIKVLPRQAAGRELLLTEVRHAREVTHSAVCRVHDAGEWEGEIFITMEYVAGEDLASLLRRIGRMPSDKVLDIARQLCAGLAAAHARGVLHRDLKPANVLIDPDGHVRIADFGIAVGRDQASEAERAAGTPAYMAPELLLSSRGASERSDLYSLGLVLYELATGRLPFEEEERRRRASRPRRWTPAAPSHFAADLDPDLERAILACLSPDPDDRPASALALAAVLPGSDALALAVEVRVTPSPEIVAAAGSYATSAPGRLWAAFGGLVLLLGVVLALGEETSLLSRAGIVKAPEVLADSARELVVALGYAEEPQAPRHGYLDDPIPYGSETSVLFWYRQESVRDVPEATRRYLYARPFEPKPEVRGRIVVFLDQSERLVYFQADPVTSSGGVDPSGPSEINWGSALAFTGIAQKSLEPAPAGRSPVPADHWIAWSGESPAGETVRIEGASAGGRVVYLAVTHAQEDWSAVAKKRAAYAQRASWLGWFVLLIVAAAVPLAFLNLRRRRGDRRGARRLVLFVLSALLAGWLLRLGWISHPMEDTADAVVERLGVLLLHGAWLWLGYLALEPYVRRAWPRVLVAWSRVLDGRLRDALVGRTVLLGALAGAFLAPLQFCRFLLPRWQGLEAPVPPVVGPWLESTLSTPLLLATALATVPRAIYDGLVTLLVLVLLRWLLRGPRLGTIAFVAVYSLLVVVTGGGNSVTAWLVLGLPVAVISAFVLVRFGFLAYVTARFVVYLLHSYPLTTDSALWYSRGGFFAAGLVAVIAGIALWAALGGPAARRHRTATA